MSDLRVRNFTYDAENKKVTGINLVDGSHFTPEGSGGGDISITNSTIEGFQGGAYGVILGDEDGYALKVTDISTFDLTKVKYLWEGQDYSAKLWDLTEVTDLRYDSEGYRLVFTVEGIEQNISIDKVESTPYPLYKYLAHNFD